MPVHWTYTRYKEEKIKELALSDVTGLKARAQSSINVNPRS